MTKAHENAVSLVYSVWKAIDWDGVAPSRRMKIYDEFTSKIRSSAQCKNLARFIEKLCAKMGVRSTNANAKIIKENDIDILKILREETQFVVILMREKIEVKKEANKCNTTENLLF